MTLVEEILTDLDEIWGKGWFHRKFSSKVKHKTYKSHSKSVEYHRRKATYYQSKGDVKNQQRHEELADRHRAHIAAEVQKDTPEEE